MKEFWLTWIYGLFMFFCGIFIGNLSTSEEALLKQAKSSIEQCQKDLPRSQVCILTAKVKEKE